MKKREKIVYDLLGLTPEENEDNLYIGEVLPVDIPEAIPKVMEGYVQHIEDMELEYDGLKAKYNEEMGKNEKQSFVMKRFLTFEEYKKFFKLNISFDRRYDRFDNEITDHTYYEYNRDWIPAYRAFLIHPTQAQYDSFILRYTPTLDDYFKILQERFRGNIKNFFFDKLKICIPESERKKHTYITGGSGSGKTELLKFLFWSYLKKNSYNLVIIDPHGDFAEEVLELNDIVYKNEVIYVDPYLHPDLCPAINPLEIKDKSEQNIDLTSQELAKVFDELLQNSSISTQMQALLIPCICVLLRRENSTFKDLQRFMKDEINSDLVELGKQSPNPQHRDFFQYGFYEKSYSQTKHSIYTKLQTLLNSTVFSNLLARNSTFDLESVLNDEPGKVIIFNLARGRMGSDSSKAYGCFVVAMLTIIAFKRANRNGSRIPIHLFIDEFHNYVGKSLELILTEARKYGLHLTLASQLVGQNMDSKLKNIALSNTAIKFTGKNAMNTLQIISKETDTKLELLKKLTVGKFAIKVGAKDSFIFSVPSFLLNGKGAMPAEKLLKFKELQKKYYSSTKESYNQSKETRNNRSYEKLYQNKPTEAPQNKKKDQIDINVPLDKFKPKYDF